MYDDRLTNMFVQQKNFIELLKEKRNFPDYPVDISSKSGQRVLKNIAYDAMQELFESIQLLKNSKDHRITNVSDIDREEFIEEISDCLHYLIEFMIVANISPQEIYQIYMKKGEINVDRINNDY